MSFGPEDPTAQHPAWVGAAHGANEAIAVDCLTSSLTIYILAVAKLMELEEF